MGRFALVTCWLSLATVACIDGSDVDESDSAWGQSAESEHQPGPVGPRGSGSSSSSGGERSSRGHAGQGGAPAGSSSGDGNASSGGERSAPPVTGEPADVAGVVDAHNLARSRVSPAASAPLRDLTWSEDAARVAREWAAQCTFQHNAGRGPYGENLFATTGSTTGADVVESWESEKSDYDYESNDCNGVCGHYTQVVWASTTGVGCARQACTTGSPWGSGAWELWVCNYAPPGNYAGQRPY